MELSPDVATHVEAKTREALHELLAGSERGWPVPDLLALLRGKGLIAERETIRKILAQDERDGLAVFEDGRWKKAAPKQRLLRWNKPPKERPAEEHSKLYGADDAPPGAYVPNMPEEWRGTWKAKLCGQRSEGLRELRVEIRRSFDGEHYRHAELVLKVYASGQVLMSMNGTAEFQRQDIGELPLVINEAREAMFLHGRLQQS
jgi:hypothetical protein